METCRLKILMEKEKMLETIIFFFSTKCFLHFHRQLLLFLMGLTLYQTKKILTRSKLKAFADNKVNVVKTMISAFYKVENSLGKGENAGDQHFLLFPKHFQKASPLRSLKVLIVW